MKVTALTLASLLLLGCNGTQPTSDTSILDPISLKIKLVDAPIDEVKNVFVNIEYIELLVDKGGKKENLIFGQNIGSIDLLTLQNGVSLPVTELSLPANTKIKQIRLVLKEFDNFLYRNDDSRCDLQTPSQQKSGTKILVKKDLILEPGSDYKMVIDFDALKSVVLKGNGDCLLKPVLKLKSLLRTPIVVEEPVEEPIGEPGVEMIDLNDQPTSEPENNL